MEVLTKKYRIKIEEENVLKACQINSDSLFFYKLTLFKKLTFF